MENGLKGGQSENTLEDIELIKQAMANSSKAFETLVKKYKKSVYYLILKMVVDSNDAEDLTQDSFAKAFNRLNLYSEKYAFSTWLFRIATNNCIDHLRKHKLKTTSLYSDSENDEGMHLTFDVKDSSLNPNEQMLKKQRHEMLKKVLKELPPKYQELIDLRYFKELSYEEIADLLHIPLGTVKAQIFRAHTLLEDAMKGMKDEV